MSIEVKQMVVKSDIKTDDDSATADKKTTVSSGGDNMNCNQAKSVVIDDCMRQIKRIAEHRRER